MQVVLIATICILLIVAGILSARLWCYSKQITHIIKELEFIGKEDTNFKLSSFCAVGKTEQMIEECNKSIEKYAKEVQRLKKENSIYKESITSISHDIRTPLTSAKGYLQMLRKEKVPEEKTTEYLKSVEMRLDNLTDMLNQLFEYARIEAGEMELEAETFNAANVFADTIAMFYEDFVRKNCEPEVTIVEKACKIKADKQAFVRIVENMLKNALIHGEGQYKLSMQTENEECVIKCSNRTDNIRKEDLDNIFERFYTTDKSRTKKTTGLGLAIIKKFTTEMGGSAKAVLEDKIFTLEIRFPIVT